MNNKCMLGIKDFYFSEFNFRNKRIFKPTKLKYLFDIKSSKEEEAYVKTVTLTVISQDGGLKLKLVAVGKFTIDESETEDKKAYILKYNTIAFMMPYIRSQVTLLTSQPATTPFIMPPINIEDMVDDLERKNK